MLVSHNGIAVGSNPTSSGTSPFDSGYERMKTFFVTGAEGVGKTSVIKKLKKCFPKIKIHDFDEVGVPEDPPLQWRLDTTLFWIKKAVKNQEKEISTAIIGLSFPSEIKSFKEFKKLKQVELILLDVSKKERKKRLKKRNATKEVIEDTNQLIALKEEFKNLPEKIIDTTNYSIQEVAESVSYFFKK